MPSLTVRNIDEEVYRALVARARQNRRSLQQEVLLLLEREAAASRRSLDELGAAWRGRLAGRDLGDVVADIRAERER